jgi:endonuclease/exonuclease/phosphatase family metal-dependent hydrolase
MIISKKTIIISSVIILIVAATVPTVILTTRDNVAPTVDFVDPYQWKVCSGIFEIEIEAIDPDPPGGAISAYEIYIDDELKAQTPEYDWDTTDYADGYHELRAIAYDKANNAGEKTITVTVDNNIDPAPTDEFKILNYNVKESGIEKEWKDVVKAENPDIAVFVETGLWDDDGKKEMYQYLNEFNGYFIDEAPYEARITIKTQWSTTGQAIFSRYPIIEFNQIESMHKDDDSPAPPTHDPFHAIVDVNGKEIHIVGVHLKCCSADFEKEQRDLEQEGLNNYFDEVIGDAPLIYIGDMNSLSPDDTGDLAGDPGADFGYGPITMLLYPEDPVYGQYASQVHNFTDVFRTLHPNDPGFTLNINTLSSRIDYIFVNQYLNTSFTSSNVGTGTQYDNLGSDHYSVDAVFDISEIKTAVSKWNPNQKAVEKENDGKIINFVQSNLIEARIKITNEMRTMAAFLTKID